MTKQSHKEIEVFKQAGVKWLQKFIEKMDKLGFREVTLEEKTRFIFDNDLQQPKRVTAENVLQAQYVYVSKNGYSVYIHTSLIGDEFADKGNAWVMIRNKKNKKVFVRKFGKHLAFTLLQKLSAYASFCKRIADDTFKYENHELVEVNEEYLAWQHKKTKKLKPFVQSYYIFGAPSEERSIVLAKERQYFKNLKKTANTVKARERTTRTTWENKRSKK